MEKYRGKYRVVCEFNRETLQPIKDDTYIQCYKNGQIYRVSDTVLAYYRPSRGNSNQLIQKLESEPYFLTELVNFDSEGDMLFHFLEKDLEKIVDILAPITSGADINPTSIKNLRKLSWFKKNKQKYIDVGLYSELSEEEKEIFRERFAKNTTK